MHRFKILQFRKKYSWHIQNIYTIEATLVYDMKIYGDSHNNAVRVLPEIWPKVGIYSEHLTT